MTRFLARCVVPVAGPPIRDGGAVAVDAAGRIVAVGRSRDVERRGEDVDLGDVAIVPGPVNAHTHLELSWIGDRRPEGGDWVTWVERLVALRAEECPETATAAAERAVANAVALGVAAIGDIANGPAAIAALARSGLRAVVFHEVFRLRADEAERTLDRALAMRDDLEARVERAGGAARVRVSLAPHAPHTTAPGLVRALVDRVRAARGRWSVHAAESDAEVAWLRDGGGPLAAFYRRRGLGDAGWDPPGVSPVAWLDRCGALGPEALVVHAVRIDDDDIATLRARGATVVVCPRSNAYLGVGRAPVPRLLEAGVPVALGTDSLASCEDLDPFAEMAALRHDHPGVPPAEVLLAATANGARALGLDEAIGTLEPGKAAALAAVRLDPPHADPLEAVTSGPRRVEAVRVTS